MSVPSHVRILVFSIAWLCFAGTVSQSRTLKSPRLSKLNNVLFGNAVARHASRRVPPEIKASEIRTAKQHLTELGYWTEESDEQFRYAIMAFQRSIGHKSTGRLTQREFRALTHGRKLAPSRIREAHIEVSLSKQLLFRVASNGTVHDILPVTTGTRRWFTADGRRRRAVTPTGSFTVYRKIDGWHKSPFGDMYYSSYIVGGVAIHGSRFITNYPRTYGCIAVPLFAAERLSELMPIGTSVVVTR